MAISLRCGEERPRKNQRHPPPPAPQQRAIRRITPQRRARGRRVGRDVADVGDQGDSAPPGERGGDRQKTMRFGDGINHGPTSGMRHMLTAAQRA